jgi:hypothetical protein
MMVVADKFNTLTVTADYIMGASSFSQIAFRTSSKKSAMKIVTIFMVQKMEETI